MREPPAKLTVRLVDGACTFTGGRGLVVYDEHGRPLVGQRAVSLQTRVHQATILVVEFIVDGDLVKVDAA